jgi:hypothetical protein
LSSRPSLLGSAHLFAARLAAQEAGSLRGAVAFVAAASARAGQPFLAIDEAWERAAPAPKKGDELIHRL